MSNSGKKSPLALNAEAQLTVNRGLRINPEARGYQGSWSANSSYKPINPDVPMPLTGDYSQGSLTAGNILRPLTASLPNFYNNTVNSNNISKICVPVFRNLIKIGRPIDTLRQSNDRINCPALGNSRPDTFLTSYAGFGTFKRGKYTDKFYNTIPTELGMVESVYPPYNYPTEGTYSYVWNNWSSLNTGPGSPNNPLQTSFTNYEEKYQYFHEYSWLTGWPAVNKWQANNGEGAPQQRHYNTDTGDLDSYSAAYFPRPDLATVQAWRSRDFNLIEYDEYFAYGFIATLARQAYFEFWSDYNTRRSNQYLEFSRSFQQHRQWQEQTNKKIASFQKTKNFIKGNYSNINDLTTSDLAGVNLAFRAFGNDMISLGKSLDLSSIHKFGTPSSFILNLQRANALTPALRMALLYSELTTTELSNILNPTFVPLPQQEKKIYNAMTLITGQDLNDIRIIVNCATTGLTSLADLINPQKMFPNSYSSLTVPQYSASTLSSKIYDFIYTGGGVNTKIKDWGDYLAGVLPSDLALACGAFMMTMNQVKNIRQMSAEKLSQVIANLEVTNKGLPQVNSADGVPGVVALAEQETKLIALGSGSQGSYRFCDFMGAMSGWPYRDEYAPAATLISQLQTRHLGNVYKKIYQKSLFNKWALLARGKGWSDPIINSTGIDPEYNYDMQVAPSYFSVGSTTISFAGENKTLPLNTRNLYTASGRSTRNHGNLTAADVWGENPDAYSTGKLFSVSPNNSYSPPLSNIYVILSPSPNTFTFESIIDPIPNPAYDPRLEIPNSAYNSSLPQGPGNEANISNPGYDPREYIPPPVTGWPGLSVTVSPGDKAYIWELEYNGYPGNGLIDGTVQNLVDAANIEILRITQGNPEAHKKLNYYWDRIGHQLFLEQRAIPFSVPKNESIYSGANRSDLDSFIRAIEEYAQDTGYCETADILEAISDLDDVGGQSIVAMEREARNARRLANTGGETDNDVPDSLVVAAASAVAKVSANGTITEVNITAPGSGYDAANPPRVVILPTTGVFGGGTGQGARAQAQVVNGSVAAIEVTDPGSGFVAPPSGFVAPPSVLIEDPPSPKRLGDAIEPGSFAGSPYTGQDPVPDRLIPPAEASYTVPEAIEVVTICNCECWD